MTDPAGGPEIPGAALPDAAVDGAAARARLVNDLAWLVTAAQRAGLGKTSQPAWYALDGIRAALSLSAAQPWELGEVRGALTAALDAGAEAALTRDGPAAPRAGDGTGPPAPDGHWPVLAAVPGLGTVIGCECGERPRKRAQRASMQHTWHQAHRRKLRLQPTEYAWPDGAADEARVGAAVLGTGGYVRVRGRAWRDGGWAPE